MVPVVPCFVVSTRSSLVACCWLSPTETATGTPSRCESEVGVRCPHCAHIQLVDSGDLCLGFDVLDFWRETGIMRSVASLGVVVSVGDGGGTVVVVASVVKLLLVDGRADPDAVDSYAISWRGHADVVKLLVADGRVSAR